MATSTAAAPLAPDPNVPDRGLAHEAGEEIERTYTGCGETKPLDSFVRTNSIGERPRCLSICKRCRNAARAETARRRREAGHTISSSSERERRAKARETYGHAMIEGAPDPAVPRLLGELLREDHDRWQLAFADVRQKNVEFALARGVEAERETWREALRATRHA